MSEKLKKITFVVISKISHLLFFPSMAQPQAQPYSTIHSKQPFTLVWVVLGSRYTVAWIGLDLGSDEGGIVHRFIS